MKQITSLWLAAVTLFACSQKKEQVILDLSNQGLKEVPDSVLQRAGLKRLYLGNAFSLYPPLSGSENDQLKRDSSFNSIEELPEAFCRLKNLESLYLTANGLKKLPPCFHLLKKLDTLDLSFNPGLKLREIEPQLSKMTGLKYLVLVGIELDAGSLIFLHALLPENTRIVTKMEELESKEVNAAD
jgi:Leucine-rich repeat (LRR) protein